MTSTTGLIETLQALVDERLDAVEQVLLHTGVPRSERGNIVTEVEGQIHELLSRRTGENEPSRADVLAVLASLDPPESYAPEGYRRSSASRRPKGPRVSVAAMLGVGAAVAHWSLMLFSIAALMAQHQGLFFATLFLSACFAMLATGLGVFGIGQIRRSAGQVIGLPAAVCAVAQLPMLLFNVGAGACFLFFGELGLYFFAGMAILGGNAVIAYLSWRVLQAPLWNED